MDNPGYEIRITKDEEGDWVATHPELRGCLADGTTPVAALAALDTMRELWMKSRLGCGQDIPQPKMKSDASFHVFQEITKVVSLLVPSGYQPTKQQGDAIHACARKLAIDLTSGGYE